jgi:DUF917 family protein
MAKTVLKTTQECEDFVRGCTVMGTGGGGAPERGMRLLSEALERGSELAWIDVEDVSDAGWTACTFGMGSIAPQTEGARKEIERLGLEPAEISLGRSIEELMQFAGVQLEAIVPVELGGSNSAGPLVYGAQLGLPCVNGDYAGRAIPEIEQTTPVLANKALAPLSSVDRWGNVCFIKEGASPGMIERLGKMLSVAAFGGCLMTGFLMPGREMSQVIVPGTLSRCFELGKTIREARERGKDPVEAIVSFTNGWLLFQGEVTEKEWEDRGGYMYGTTHLSGLGEFEGHRMSVWFKNENHIVWKDDEPFVTSPDIVALVGIDTGEAKTNTAISAGDRMAVIGMKGLDSFRTPEGLKALGPAHFGFDIDYTPIEKLV